MKLIERPLVALLRKRLREPSRFLQVVVGPRQVGKTTAVQQVLRKWEGPSHYASADLPAAPGPEWIETQWRVARQEARESRRKTLFVLDEVQKINRWAEVVKALFDEDRRTKAPIQVVILGSASLHVQRGAEESLAGRFEFHFCPHWSWPECKDAFGWSLDQWLYFGGYPGAAPLIRDQRRWASYVSDSLIEPVLSKDVLQLAPVQKPALLRQLFMLAVRSPAQILSFNKMLGQLQDAGNTVTLAHYLELLSSAFLVSGLNLWGGGVLRQRASSPKLILWNSALVTALAGFDLRQARKQGEFWGRLVENAVGAYLLNHSARTMPPYYWRQEDAEVDYVLEMGRQLVAIEVKSGRRSATEGLRLFGRNHPKVQKIIVGTGGIPLEKFFSNPPEAWL